LAAERQLEDRRGNADRRAEFIGGLIDIVLCPAVDLLDRGEKGVGHRRIRRHEFLLAEIELPIGGDAPLAIGDRARVERQFGRGLERVPDRPGVDRAMFEGGARIGRRQKDDIDIGIFQAGASQRLDQQIMDVRTLVQRHALALEFGEAVDRAVFGNEYGFAARRRRFVPDIEQRRSGGLREDRRRFAGDAKIQRADVERLEQLRPAGEFRPGDGEAERF